MGGNPLNRERTASLAHWMREVLVHWEKAETSFAPDPVHDLRTSLRRCRSIAEGMRVFDRDPGWKKMKRAGKDVFQSLGGLRDVHVIAEWVEKVAPKEDSVSNSLIRHLAEQEQELKRSAAAKMAEFDRKQWQQWADELPERAGRIPLDSPVLAHVALEYLEHAYRLHRIALRNRTNVAFHELRIGLKHFRYMLENFLPALYESWGKDLKELQDLLGEVHDCDVLWQIAVKIKAFPDTATRAEWRSRIEKERNRRLEIYRSKMIGPESLWSLWRAGLPQPSEFRHLGLERLRLRASFMDPDFGHSRLVCDLALQLYDGLDLHELIPGNKRDAYRDVLEAAALMHDVGLHKANKGHHKISAREIRKVAPPLGWTASEIRLAALVARYHRGALPRVKQKRFAALSSSRQRLVQFLAGILRLACACDRDHEKPIRHLSLAGDPALLTIKAKGYIEATPLAEHLAAARYLLELACQRPILLIPAEQKIEASAA